MSGKVVDEQGLARQLQKARQQAGLTQQAMCQKAGLSYSTLAKIERGAIKAPSIFTVKQIADVLGLSLDELLGGLSAHSKKKRTKSGVRFIYFDINGCLVRFFHRAFTAIAEETDISPDIIETSFWQHNDAICTGAMSLDEFNRVFAKDLGLSSIVWQDYYLTAIEPIREMHELVSWAAQYYYVGLLSNIGEGLVERMKREGMLPDVAFDAIVDSSKVGHIKPDPKIYEVAEAMAGVAANEILLVDDTRANLVPARKAGWNVMWFNDYDAVESTEKVRIALEPA